MPNKVGFTEEQQKELARMIGIATRCAAVTTAIVTRPADPKNNHEVAEAIGEMVNYIRDTYPDGPLHVKRALEDIVRFCDLPMIVTAEEHK
jgi:hypothetical protein